ncbi:hypothetical protein Tco_0179077 [Tanacetum coccineum]
MAKSENHSPQQPSYAHTGHELMQASLILTSKESLLHKLDDELVKLTRLLTTGALERVKRNAEMAQIWVDLGAREEADQKKKICNKMLEWQKHSLAYENSSTLLLQEVKGYLTEPVFRHGQLYVTLSKANAVGDSLITTHQGNKQVKDNKIDLFVQKYEEFTITDDETIDCAFSRFNTIITSLKALDESFSSHNHVRKFLRALPSKWRPKELQRNKKECTSLSHSKQDQVLSDDETSASDSNDGGICNGRKLFQEILLKKRQVVRKPYDDNKNFRKNQGYKKEENEDASSGG